MLKHLLYSYLVLSCSAAPNVLEKRQGASCNRDDCLRNVFGTAGNANQPATASADCSSFLAKTISLCTLTVTNTAVYTSTVSTLTLTSAAVQTINEVMTLSITATDTQTIVVPMTVSPTVTVMAPLTSTTTISTTKTVTITTNPPNPPSKRHLDSADVVNLKRQVTCPLTTSASKLPSYVSKCGTSAAAASRFSSVCLCNGITASTTILSQVTTTIVSTSVVPTTATQIVTSTSLTTNTDAVTLSFTVVDTETLTSGTSTAPAQTLTVTPTGLASTTTTYTTTTTVCAPTKPTNALVNGNFNSNSISPWIGQGPFQIGPERQSSNDYALSAQANVGQVGSYSGSITQHGVNIGDGATVRCSLSMKTAFYNGNTGVRGFSLTVAVDGQICATGSSSGNSGFNPISGQNVMVTGDVHDVVVSFTLSTGAQSTQLTLLNTLLLDNIEVAPVAGPGAPAQCPA